MAGAMQLDLSHAQVMKDETGRPFIIVRDQGKKKRMHGTEAVKQHILAARTVANIVKTSLGPRGLDKILISPGMSLLPRLHPCLHPPPVRQSDL